MTVYVVTDHFDGETPKILPAFGTAAGDNGQNVSRVLIAVGENDSLFNLSHAKISSIEIDIPLDALNKLFAVSAMTRRLLDLTEDGLQKIVNDYDPETGYFNGSHTDYMFPTDLGFFKGAKPS